jgi:2-oxoglutarate dehydrogenase complex dehydrogenase (E1) component-like enzyme
MSERTRRGAPVAVVRVEQLYPFPGAMMREVLGRYPSAGDVVWLQEEPDNMGPWHFVEARFWNIKADGYELRLVSRIGSGSPATGSKGIHDQELADLMDDTFRDL